MTLTIDIIDGSRGRYDAEGWQELSRVATVTGLVESGQAQLVEAITATGMPAIDDAHPSAEGLRLTELAPECLGPGKARVVLTYTRKAEADTPIEGGGAGSSAVRPTIEIGTTLTQVEANKDVNGTVVTVTYNGTKKPANDQAQQIATYSRLVPQTTLTITRLESAIPLYTGREYVGKTNMKAWAADLGCDPNTWLCTGIVGKSTDGGKHYEVTYSFQYCGFTETGTWDVNAYWRGSDGKLPPDLVAGTGIVPVQVYAFTDFDNLGF